MKILIVNLGDSNGGASIAANRLQECLMNEGVDSKLLVLNKKNKNQNILTVNTFFSKSVVFFSKLETKLVSLFYPKKTTNRFSASLIGFNLITRVINSYKPDIVHLHWVQSGMLSISDISKIKKPIVWSLHDVWGFTGGCHYNENCKNFEKTCGSCKVLGSTKFNDLSSVVYSAKQKSYEKHGNITFIGLSKWMAQLAKKSSLSKGKVINLPNPIDTRIYKRNSKLDSLSFFGMDHKNNNILIGAMSLKIERKGFKKFLGSTKHITSNFNLITFGESSVENSKISHTVLNVGIISKVNEMVMLYNASCVTVVPSLEENLSNVIMESLACGTPVVAFDIGGNSDMITHKVNGYLAIPFDEIDLARGVDWVLNNKEITLSENAIEKVQNDFDYPVVAKKYLEFYKKII